MPRRGIALLLVVVTAGGAASVLAFRGREEEPRGQPGASTETTPGAARIEASTSPGTIEAEVEPEPRPEPEPQPEPEPEPEREPEPEAPVEPEAAAGPAQSAERSLLIGFVDDPSFRWRPYRGRMLDAARVAGASVVRAMIYWHRLAPRPPKAGEPPFDEPRLFELDELVAETANRNMEVMLTIWGTPV